MTVGVQEGNDVVQTPPPPPLCGHIIICSPEVDASTLPHSRRAENIQEPRSTGGSGTKGKVGGERTCRQRLRGVRRATMQGQEGLRGGALSLYPSRQSISSVPFSPRSRGLLRSNNSQFSREGALEKTALKKNHSPLKSARFPNGAAASVLLSAHGLMTR